MRRLTRPASEPVSIEEANKQLNLTATDDEVHVGRLIRAARQWVEGHTHQRIVRQEWRLYFHSFADVMALAPSYAREVSQIQYIDSDGNTQTAATSLYDVDVAGQQIILAFNQSWPSTRAHPNTVWIDVWAGMYDETASPAGGVANIEEPVKQAMLMIVQQLYDGEDEHGADYLLQPYRMYRAG